MSTSPIGKRIQRADNSMALTRRAMVRSLAGGSLLLPGMISQLLAESGGVDDAVAGPLAPKDPPETPTAKRVIFLFMTGGMSHIDTFDPKPDMPEKGAQLMRSPWSAKPYGESGIWISSLFPHISEIVDELCLIRSPGLFIGSVC